MTLVNFKLYVKQVLKRTDKDTEIVQAYNDMVIWVAACMPHGGYKYQSYISTVAETPDYPLPTDLIHLIHPVRLLEGSGTNDSGYPLEFISKEKYDILEPNPHRTNPSTGKPTRYAVFSRSILPQPIPDKSTYLIEINWSKRPTAQSADADLTSLGSEWDEVLRAGALERLYEGIELYQEAGYWASKYRDAEGNPIGMCKKLFDIERAREEKPIGQVQNNDL
jgi:hypothetical protein